MTGHEAEGPPALVVFAKVPTAGRVKTRLTPPLTAQDAADLYAAFLGDALAGFGRLGVDVRLYLPPGGGPMPDGLVPPSVTLHAQRGQGLGARMDAALSEMLAAGAGCAAVIGTDHPTLPLGHVAAAFDALAVPGTVALGPTEDGGFYLLGLDRPRPALFAGMAYSHADVFVQTQARAHADGARLRVLPAAYDVDDGPSLVRLVGEWQAGAAVGARTAASLARLVRDYPALASRPEPAPSG